MNTATWRRPIRICATAMAILAAAGPAAGQKRIRPGTTLLPGFPQPDLADRAAIFSNSVYTAWLTTTGYLQVTLLKDGQPAGPSFDLFTPHFRGSKEKGGYVDYEYLDSLRAESKMPVLQPATPVRFRVDSEYGARMSAAISFAERSIALDVAFRPNPRVMMSRAHPSAWLFGLPGFSRKEDRNLSPELQAVCEEKYVDLVPEKGETVSIGFAQDIKHQDLPPAREWTVRGLWDGYALRGRIGTRGYTFRYHQYMGTKPAQGFRMFYTLGRDPESNKAIFDFIPYDKPVVGLDPEMFRGPRQWDARRSAYSQTEEEDSTKP